MILTNLFLDVANQRNAAQQDAREQRARANIAEAKVRVLERRTALLISEKSRDLPTSLRSSLDVAAERDAAKARVRSLELDLERVKKETEYLESRCAELGRLLAHARKTAAENLETKRKLQARCAELEKRSAEHKANTKCEYCENTGRDCYGEVCEWCEEWVTKTI